MKTKKEILESCIEIKKNSGAEYSKDSVQEAVLEAMDEYALQKVKTNSQAIINYIFDVLGIVNKDVTTMGDIQKEIMNWKMNQETSEN